MKYFSLVILLPLSLLSLPRNPIVREGEAIFRDDTQQLHIHTGENTEIDWESFSIDEQEFVRFEQPSIESMTLNRVSGQAMSVILGKIEANGKVLLINPSGLLIGREAKIDTGSFMASTLDLQRDFGKGLCFKGSSGAKIVNLGEVFARTGDLFFIGEDLDNQGSLEALNGSVALVGSAYRKNFECQFTDGEVSRLTQSGQIRSSMGGNLGGKIHLMADEIYIFGTSQIATSNRFSGGEILVGAGYQGKDPDFTNGRLIWVENGAGFAANTWENGSGGRVILYTDGVTDFSGLISARGGKDGGDGGLAEVSGKGLSYRGLADLRSPLGKVGMLLLDPTDITVSTGGDAGYATTVPAVVFPFCDQPNQPCTLCAPPVPCVANVCPPCATAGSLGAGTYAQYQGTANTATVNSTTLAAQLGLSHVAIDAVGGGGAGPGGGSITWAVDFTPTSADVYNTANDLVLSASGNVTINATRNVQNGNSGNLILQSTGALVTINAQFGSQNGQTQICAPNAAVIINSGGQVGFHTPNNQSSDGSIDISCLSLALNANAGANGAQIGHGQMNAAVDTATGVLTPANITVNVVNNIAIASSGGGIACIGHGSSTFNNTALNATNQNGNIFVASQSGNITLSSSNILTRIGHGSFLQGAGANFPNFVGNITVEALGAYPANGNITLSTTGANNESLIGHGGIANNVTVSSVVSNITLSCAGDLTLSPSTGSDTGIGACMTNLGAGGVTQNMLVTVGNDIFLSTAGGGRLAYIGTQVVNGGAYVGDIEVFAGRDINMTSTIANQSRIIGTRMTSQAGDVVVVASRNITMQTTGVAPANSIVFWINGGQNVSVAAGGNITLNNTLSGSTSGIGTYNNLNITPTVQIFAAGNIIGTIGTATGLVNFGRSPSAAPPPSFNVSIRAGGDIQMGNGINTAANAGFIFIEADSPFFLGELWDYNMAGTSLTSVCNTALPIPVTDICLFQATAPFPITAASPVQNADNFGAFRFDPNANVGVAQRVFTTTAGLTINSSFQRVDGTLQNFDIPAAIGTNSATLTAGFSSLSISGSICTDGFNNIGINAAVSTTGFIDIKAGNDLNANAAITTTGANSFLSLVSSCSAPVAAGSSIGNVNLNAAGGVNALNGILTISAGVIDNAAPFCAGFICPPQAFAGANTASINLNGGAVVTTGGPMFLSALDDINVNLTSTGISSTSGNIDAEAGDNINVNRSIITGGAGTITLISDRNYNGAGDVNLNAAVTAVDGAVIIDAGVGNQACAPAFTCPVNRFGTASIIQSSNAITTSTGPITLLAETDITLSGAAVCINSTSGAVNCTAGNAVTVNRDITTGSNGTITIISDRDEDGQGDVNLNGTLTTSNGAITVDAGIFDGSCSPAFCQTSQFTGASVLQTSGQIISTGGGAVTVLAQEDISFSTPIVPCVSTTGTVQCFAGNDILLSSNQIISSSMDMTFIAGHDMTLFAGASISATAGASLTIVVDNNFPNQPFIILRPIGILTMGAGASLEGTPLLIFTALQNFNSIDPTALLSSIDPYAQGYPGTMFNNSSIEQWCTNFQCPATAVAAGLGSPFTFFYKNCLQLVVAEAMKIVDEFLVNLHPYNEFPGWVSRFLIEYEKSPNSNDQKLSSFNVLQTEPYFLRRRHLSFLNHPKVWTVWTAE